MHQSGGNSGSIHFLCAPSVHSHYLSFKIKRKLRVDSRAFHPPHWSCLMSFEQQLWLLSLFTAEHFVKEKKNSFKNYFWLKFSLSFILVLDTISWRSLAPHHCGWVLNDSFSSWTWIYHLWEKPLPSLHFTTKNWHVLFTLGMYPLNMCSVLFLFDTSFLLASTYLIILFGLKLVQSVRMHRLFACKAYKACSSH